MQESVEPEGSRLALRRAPYQKLHQQPGSRPGPHHFGAGSHRHQQRSINVLRIGRQPLASPKFSERKIIFARHWILFFQHKGINRSHKRKAHQSPLRLPASRKGAEESYHCHAPVCRHVAPRHSHDVSKANSFSFSFSPPAPPRFVLLLARSSVVVA